MKWDFFDSELFYSVSLDGEFRILRANKKTLRILGKDRCYGKIFSDILTEESGNIFDNLIRNGDWSLEKTKSLHLHLLGKRSSSEQKVLWEITKLGSGFTLVGVDKTKEYLRKKKIHYMELFQQSYIDSTNSLVFLKDANGRYTTINKAMEDLLGMKKKDILGKRDEEILGNRLAFMLGDSEKQVLEERDVLTSVEKIDEDLIFEFYRFPIIHEEKLMGIGGIGIDVTFQVNAQINLSQKIDENNAIISAIPDLVFIVSGDFRIVDFNVKDPEDLLVQPAQFIGKSMRDAVPEDIAVKSERMVAMARHTHKIQSSEYSLFLREEKRFYEARCVMISEDRFLFLVRNITREKKEALELQNDINMARDLQYSTLPKLDSIDNDFLDVSVVYKPLSSISGDIYDFYMSAPGVYRFVIIDAVGHGIQSSLLTMALRTELERLKPSEDISPGELLTKLNKSLVSTFKSRDNTCTCCVLDIDTSKKQFRYSSGGHPVQFFRRDLNSLETFSSRSPLIGLIDNYKYGNQSLPWCDDFHFFLFTDGIFEFMDHSNILFSEERLLETIESITQKPSLQINRKAIGSEIYDTVLETCKEGKLRDDLTLLHIFKKNLHV